MTKCLSIKDLYSFRKQLFFTRSQSLEYRNMSNINDFTANISNMSRLTLKPNRFIFVDSILCKKVFGLVYLTI